MQSRNPPAPQVSSNEDYGTIADEDREHIDEVVSCCDSALARQFRHCVLTCVIGLVRFDGHEEERMAE